MQGLDTVEANEQLGFGEDERSYEYVPFILEVSNSRRGREGGGRRLVSFS